MSDAPVERLPAALARRIALAAQGFAEPRPPAPVGTRQLRRLTDRLAVVQIDSVNVLSRSHYLPAFSRLGSYPRAALDDLTARRHAVFEYWAHEASFLPVRLQPYLRWRMAAAEQHAWGNMVRLQRERPGYVAEVLDRVRDDGPLKASDLAGAASRTGPAPCGTGTPARSRSSGCSSPARVTATHRTTAFERVYDLTERVLPRRGRAGADARAGRRRPRAGAHRRPGARRGHRARPARLLPAARRPPPGTAIAELADAGELLPVEVAGWGAPAWLDPEARRPRWIRARALLSPFDSLVWERPRVERIFGFRYRLEIYTPAAKRVHGYYVLPFLLGDQLVARVDLKADRQAGVLRVQAAHGEEGIDRAAGRRRRWPTSSGSWPTGWSSTTSTSLDRGDLARDLARGRPAPAARRLSVSQATRRRRGPVDADVAGHRAQGEGERRRGPRRRRRRRRRGRESIRPETLERSSQTRRPGRRRRRRRRRPSRPAPRRRRRRRRSRPRTRS